jgi:hypothetical protein
VNGSGNLPNGLYSDAEFVLGGPYDHETQTNQGSSIRMALEMQNGHNLQAVPNAWNFGADTNNAIKNVTTVPASQGSLPAVQTGSGSGILGRLYSATQEAQVTVTALAPNGTLDVNGASVNCSGTQATVEVIPGAYEFRSVVDNQTWYSNRSLTSGEVISFPIVVWNPITVTETGLPAATPWSVNWSGTLYRSTTSTISLQAVNGTDRLAVTAVPGYFAHPLSQNVVVDGPRTIDVNWSLFLWSATIDETGLPGGTAWGVVVGNVWANSTGATATLAEANGTYPWSAHTEYAYVPESPPATLNVSPSSLSFSVTFIPRNATIVGTISPTSAVLTIDGTPVPVVQGGFNATVLAGVYAVEATDTGYNPWVAQVTTTPGNATPLLIEMNASHNSTGPPPGGGSSPANSLLVPVAVGVGIAVVVGAALAILLRRRGPGPPTH